MAELSLEAPLAYSEDWPECNDCLSLSSDQADSNVDESLKNNHLKQADNDLNFFDKSFKESMSNSLEDLINNFDEKITNCFKNYDESIEQFAPVQVRPQEDLIHDSPLWGSLTENLGNVLPIDWAQTYARKLQLPTLNLNNIKSSDQLRNNNENELVDPNVDEEEIAKDLDLHSLILSSIQQEPIFTAEQVLEEIDEIMKESSPIESSMSDIQNLNFFINDLNARRTGIKSLLYDDKLKTLSITQLNELYIELERLIQANSETLVQELALRDELEYAKELRSTFISLLLTIQNKRKQHFIEKKKGKVIKEPKYLTTVIPYNSVNIFQDLETIQVLIKILKAINENSPTVPTLLTDFILKVLCPT